MGAEAVSNAFQVFRTANLKAGEGQYFTPSRVIAAAVSAMEIQTKDRIIDPATHENTSGSRRRETGACDERPTTELTASNPARAWCSMPIEAPPARPL